MIGVKGWYSANCRTPAPIVSAGTIALLRNGSMISGTVIIPAVSGVLAAKPRATVSQVVAKLTSTMKPIAPSHSTKLASGRNPAANATAMMAAMAIRLRSIVATT
jgi:hypothetical protein